MRKLSSFALLLLLAPAAEAREGFGFTKKAVEMTRTRPPGINTPARRIKVTVDAERSADKDDAQTLRRYTEEVILAGAGTLAPNDKPELTVKLSLDRLESHETWETKTEYSYQQTGTKQEWNSKKNKYETKPVYSNVPIQKNVKVLTGSISGAYDIADRAGKINDSGSVSSDFRQKYEEGSSAPPPSKVEDDLLQKAAKSVAARLVPTTDRVSVLVPKGSFESFIPLAEANAWEQYLAAVEAVAAKRDVRQEAYRQYALGVAKEGLAYQTADRARAIELLRAAVGHYETAIRSHPGERIFSEAYSSLFSSGAGAPLPRAKASMVAYEAWSGGGSAPTTRVAAGGSVMRNQTVIEMAKAGLADENILLAIDGAERTEFDTSPEALIALAKSGVSRTVIARMQKKR